MGCVLHVDTHARLRVMASLVLSDIRNNERSNVGCSHETLLRTSVLFVSVCVWVCGSTLASACVCMSSYFDRKNKHEETGEAVGHAPMKNHSHLQ